VSKSYKIKKKTWSFWEVISRLILRNRISIIICLLCISFFWLYQSQNLKFTFNEANLLPDNHKENLIYKEFLKHFGDEGNSIAIALQDSLLFTKEKLQKWNELSESLNSFTEIDYTLSIGNLKILKKNKTLQKFDLVPFLDETKFKKKKLVELKRRLLEELPFYENLLYNKSSQTFRTIIFMKRDIVNTSIRKEFIFNKFIPLIKKFEKENNINLRISGMPYIRTLNAQNIVNEMGFFVFAAMLITSFIFFLFFKSIRATIISMIVVLIGVIWSIGTLGLFQYEITVLTALIPPLIIVIGIPNCIFLINKYQLEISKHGNQIKSLQRVIVKIGNATLMTNLTTAGGFATFILTNSELLKEFGIIASLNVIGIFIISLLIIPIFYSFMGLPKEKHLKHLENKSITSLVNWMENKVKNKRINIYIISIIALITSIIGIYQIKISGNMLEDMPRKKEFFKDIIFFNNEFDGIVPLEIIVDSKKENGIMNLSTIKKMDKLHDIINEIPELSKPISIVNAIKYSKQVYYNGNAKFYKIPSTQENNFISQYIKNSTSDSKILENYIDESGQFARITSFMKDTGTERMEEIENDLLLNIKKIFPEEKYIIKLTGKSLLFLKGTKYLIKNLILSLSLAILLIAIFMAFMFRSFKMIIISLIPNLLPLIITAGMMGYIGIAVKPSTILVFSIAFGISVDDTIHFLAKYRQELIDSNWKIKRSVYSALKETGVSMFYTSIVLFFGFSVFMISEFGGTVALGGLISITLVFAMLTNLLLLPSLLISLQDYVSNEKIIIEPKIQVLEIEDDRIS